jgi:hypothetical protein
MMADGGGAQEGTREAEGSPVAVARARRGTE